MDIQIRPATEADKDFLRSAIVVLQDIEHAMHDTRPADTDIVEAYQPWLYKTLADNKGALLIAEVDGIPAGYIACYVVQVTNPAETADSNRYGLIQDICVLPDFRGKNIAQYLLTAAEAHLVSQSVTRIRICTLAANTSAIRAYQKHQFRDYEVVMDKRVGPISMSP